jgi:predicted phosphate transport protein (TIGR00153 family)
LGISAPIKGKGDKFIGLLIQQSQITAEGLSILQDCMRELSDDSLDAMRAKEYEGDEVRRVLIDELHKTFVTPLDREDIYNISHHIDEMLDYAHTTIQQMVILEVEADDYLDRMVDLNRQAADEMAMAMVRLQENPLVALEHARRTRKLESEVEHIYRQAIADLFTKAKDFKPLMEMLRRREVYRHVSNMADQADAAAHTLGMIVIKMT